MFFFQISKALVVEIMEKETNNEKVTDKQIHNILAVKKTTREITKIVNKSTVEVEERPPLVTAIVVKTNNEIIILVTASNNVVNIKVNNVVEMTAQIMPAVKKGQQNKVRIK